MRSPVLISIVLITAGCVSNQPASTHPLSSKPGRVLAEGEFPETLPIFSATMLDRLPKAVRMVNPQYPFELRRAHMQGTVVVRFIIGPDGSIVSARAISSPDPSFSQAAEAAVRQWRFEPGEKDGRKVYTRTEVPITFSLD